jgi:hypothetical protein
MGAPRRRVIATIVLFALVGGGSAGPVWRVRAQKESAPPGQQTTVQVLKDRMPPPSVTSGDRGATYHSLEHQATRVTTRFADATVVADRTPDGQMSTRLTDLSGNDMMTFRVHRVDAGSDSLEFAFLDTPNAPARHAARRSGLRPTLDWSIEQAYSLWKDRHALAHSSLDWQDTLMRPSGAQRRNLSAAPMRTVTEWRGGFRATVIKKIGSHISYVTGRQTTGLVFISRFEKDNVEIGSSQWWPQEQTFAWEFPGLTEGYVDSARLRQAGGWPLAPDMAWMNIQNFAFYQFHTLVAGQPTASAPNRGWLEKARGVIAPILHANEPGCDGLHWLDGSIFRPCCDSHDRCYSRQEPACGARSWWMWWSSWQCTRCNIYAVACFVSGGSHAFHRTP